jgi:hypothetical protein
MIIISLIFIVKKRERERDTAIRDVSSRPNIIDSRHGVNEHGPVESYRHNNKQNGIFFFYDKNVLVFWTQPSRSLILGSYLSVIDPPIIGVTRSSGSRLRLAEFIIIIVVVVVVAKYLLNLRNTRLPNPSLRLVITPRPKDHLHHVQAIDVNNHDINLAIRTSLPFI